MKEVKTEPKQRKVTAGPIREKARTVKKLISAVGKVLKKKGYAQLTVANIASAAQVDRKLVYVYFGSLDNLVEAYITEQDYWNAKAKRKIEQLLSKEQMNQEEMVGLLFGQFEAVFADQTLQRILQWEISEKNAALRKVCDAREEVGEKLIQKLENSLPDQEFDIRGILALQTAGLYYLALHAKSNGSTFCGIDILTVEGKNRIHKSLKDILKLTTENA